MSTKRNLALAAISLLAFGVLAPFAEAKRPSRKGGVHKSPRPAYGGQRPGYHYDPYTGSYKPYAWKRSALENTSRSARVSGSLSRSGGQSYSYRHSDSKAGISKPDMREVLLSEPDWRLMLVKLVRPEYQALKSWDDLPLQVREQLVKRLEKIKLEPGTGCYNPDLSLKTKDGKPICGSD